MKRVISFFMIMAIIAMSTALKAQNEEGKPEGYKFTTVKDIPVTKVKNQYRSGTCWSFSGIGMLEAELIRMGKGEISLSDMYIVRCAYAAKAERYVRFHGHVNFGGGGAFHDVMNVVREMGITPESVYDGLKYGEGKHVHGEIDEVLKAFIEAIVKNENKKITPVWRDGFNGLLDTYFGKIPENFDYNGKKYTPKTFASEMGINPDDYIPITSFSHHPFYKKFVMELPDNWAHETVYNVPLEDMWQIVVYAVNNGYTVGWATDVSEKGFSWNKGIAVIPEIKIEELSGSEKAKWEKLTEKERNEQLYKLVITQEIRQKAFDNYQTEDDHGMLICGLAKDQNGTDYLKVKNSWSDENHVYNGFLYASKSYFLYKTTNIMLHKNAIPKEIAKKLGL
ncbi:MAG: Peptidase C1-like family protein [Bacteroidetes bacterium ADurb.Bin408]|nr:MAG: Peptidase C1-like family protein [Bacteroidetes bacterium ADurb.Bin408]